MYLVKGIQTITYNHLNLPSKVDFGAGKYITYLYDAAACPSVSRLVGSRRGIKLQQKVYENNALKKTTDYSGPFIYENDTLQFIQHDEGRIIPGLDPGSPYEYQYNLKDHLGNVRLTFTTQPNTLSFTATMETENARLEVKDIKLWEGKIDVLRGRKSNGRLLELAPGQVMDMYDYVLQVRNEIAAMKPKRKAQTRIETDKLFIGEGGNCYSFSNMMTQLMIKVRKINPTVQNAKQVRASVNTKWLKAYNLREAQYLAGHR